MAAPAIIDAPTTETVSASGPLTTVQLFFPQVYIAPVISDGATLDLLGGTAQSALLSGGELLVEAGATAIATTGSGTLFVNGGLVSDTVLTNGTETDLAGTVFNTTLFNSTQTIFSGAIANGSRAEFDATVNLLGGTLIDATADIGGTLSLQVGTARQVHIDGGTVDVFAAQVDAFIFGDPAPGAPSLLRIEPGAPLGSALIQNFQPGDTIDLVGFGAPGSA